MKRGKKASHHHVKHCRKCKSVHPDHHLRCSRCGRKLVRLRVAR